LGPDYNASDHAVLVARNAAVFLPAFCRDGAWLAHSFVVTLDTNVKRLA